MARASCWLAAACFLALLSACQASPASAPAPAPVEVLKVAAAPAPELAPPPPAPEPPPQVSEVKVARIAKKKTFTGTLAEMGLGPEESGRVVEALKKVFNFKKMRLGDQLRLTKVGGRFETFEYRSSALDEWLVRREGEGWSASKRAVEVEQRVAVVNLAVTTSLYEAILDAGEDPGLAVDVADIFAWDIDFYRDVRKGDRLRVVVEKQLVHGRLLKYGEILGVRYEGEQVGSKKLLRYTPQGAMASYFDEKGNSAKKSFLKSPLKYVHITSGYGGRTHPFTGFVQNHQGVDFSAEVGTPVWAVADGVVTRMVRLDPGGGNFVFIRHPNGLETGYLHLSRFADGLSVGARVHQKQVVAFTGNTGMSTGPHLHYAMKRGGDYINPLAQKFPRAEPLPKAELARFEELTAQVRATLDAQLVASF
jgi:murein DD-endopeptidase MepM/ murein hydrolase activator NlpD